MGDLSRGVRTRAALTYDSTLCDLGAGENTAVEKEAHSRENRVKARDSGTDNPKADSCICFGKRQQAILFQDGVDASLRRRRGTSRIWSLRRSEL